MASEPVTINPSVRVAFQVTKREFRNAVRQIVIRRPRTQLMGASAIVFIAAGIVAQIQGESGALFVVAGITLLGAIAIAVCLRPFRSWRVSSSFHDRVELLFDGEAVSIWTTSSSAKSAWMNFHDVIEADGNYIIRTKGGGFYIVPKRVFAPGDELQFRTLVQAHLPATFHSDL